jgi:hypothetical protein
MKNAVIAAVVAAFVASGSAFAASSLINGHRIKRHTIPPDRFTTPACLKREGCDINRWGLVDGDAIAQGATGSGNEIQATEVTCPSGWAAIGGGFDTGTTDDIVSTAVLLPAHNSYAVIATNESTTASFVRAHAFCVHGAWDASAFKNDSMTPRQFANRVRAFRAERRLTR